MSDKHYFANKWEFDEFKAKHQHVRFRDYDIETPAKYPCVGVMYSEPVGDYGTHYIMEEYVYLSDFEGR